MAGAYRAVDRDQVGDGEHLEPGTQVAHRAQPGDGQDHERRPAARGQRQPAGPQQRGAEQLAPPDECGPDSPVPTSSVATPTAIAQSVTPAGTANRPLLSMGAP
ncbi:hypothetical protein GCM10010393_42080 [Streptomyces gobitricini]|uniref:Uncharacterized protein n=1 Tax=Streptomyces gobitricini TaxID=68211 RepID=A0ABN3MN12_9ACTN